MLIGQYERLVYTICRQFVGDDALAEDLAQETFLSAWMHRDDCPPGSYKPWLARIAANKAKDHLKSAYHRRVHAEEDESCPCWPGQTLRRAPSSRRWRKDGAARIEADIRALKEPYHLVSVAYFRAEAARADCAGAWAPGEDSTHSLPVRGACCRRN